VISVSTTRQNFIELHQLGLRKLPKCLGDGWYVHMHDIHDIHDIHTQITNHREETDIFMYIYILVC
jgi:hypothetical protein